MARMAQYTLATKSLSERNDKNIMKKELQELLQAARLIQNYCRSREYCEECPFYDGYDCELQIDPPHQWDVYDVKEKNNG